MAGAGFERFKHSWPGYKRVMKSEGTQAMLQRKADAVAAAVDSQLDVDFDDDWEIIADVQVGRTRAGAMVSGVPLSIEEAEGILASSIDAAR